MSLTLASNLKSLSLRDRLAQLLFVRIGSNLPPVRTVEDDLGRVQEMLAEVPLGGLLLFNGQCDQTANSLQQLQNATRIPLLIAADIERGVGQQLRGYTLFPHAMAFDALGENAAQQVHEFRTTHFPGRSSTRNSHKFFASGRREYRSSQPHHLDAVVRQRSPTSCGISNRLCAWLPICGNVIRGKAFSWPWQHSRRLTSHTSHGGRQPSGVGKL